MFTGIVEDIGTIEAVEKQENLYKFSVNAPKISRGIKLGDSVSVDGVCLTVAVVKKSVLTFDLMKDTLDSTTLGVLGLGARVNLERAMQTGGRFGGHVVTGHVDGCSKIIEIIRGKNYIEYRLDIPKGLKKFLVTKGSVTLNGISLTVGKVLKDCFSVSLIPFTMKETTMSDKKAGDRLNIEADILARYILNAK